MPKVMYSIKATNQFRKDVKRCKKRGFDIGLSEHIIDLLQKQEKFPKNTNHINYQAITEIAENVT